ncbi:MAG TPA: MoaD/ThiS family protein [Phycisphaerae bacterium]|nr:MoaD/ThiS family protein [Phycisphaerae bacterium]
MRILFINNSGAGFADYIEVDQGTTIQSLLEKKVHNTQPEELLIRVNRQPVPRDYLLQEGDRVSATPVKIEGATA